MKVKDNNMKSARKAPAWRRAVRRPAPLSLSMRIERLEKAVLFRRMVATAPVTDVRFTKLDANGKPTTGDHVAVHDLKTGLTWTAEPLQSGKDMNHADAVKACAGLDLLGQKDWRAPTVEELLSVVDYMRYDPAVDPEFFKGPYGWTWSSTVAKYPAGYAWFVSLGDGFSGRYPQDFANHVRAVRAGQSLDFGI
jgi:hypothetical protein